MNEHDFRKNLIIHGANLHRWPEELQQAGLDALHRSRALQKLVVEQADFDRALEARGYEEPSKDLADRIIKASRETVQKTSFSISAVLSELFGFFIMPKRMTAFVSVIMIMLLLIGFAIGFSGPLAPSDTEQASTGLQDIFYSEGVVL